MATDRRDVELVIRAKDLSTADLRRVEAAVESVSAAIESQVRAANKGEIGVSELRAELEKLRQAGASLAQQQGLIDSFTRISGAIAKAETAAQNAKAALAAFNAAGSDLTKTTETQAQRIANLEKSIAKQSERLKEAKAAQAAYNQGLSEAEAITEKQAKKQETLAKRVEAAAATLSESKDKLKQYNQEVSRINTERVANEQARLARAVESSDKALVKLREDADKASTSLKALGVDTNNLANDQARIFAAAQKVGTASTTLTTAISAAPSNAREAAQAARDQAAAEKAAQAAAEQRARAAQEYFATLKASLERRAALERAVTIASQNAAREEFQANEKRLAQFRDLADQAERTARSFSTFSAASNKVATESRDALNAVLAAQGGLANINNQERRTLGGLEGVATAAAANIARIEKLKGPVEDFVATLQDMERTLSRVQAIARQVDGYRTQERAVAQAEAAYKSAQAQVARLAAAMRNPATASKELGDRLQQAAVNARSAGASLVEQTAALGRLSQGLKDAGVDTKNLGAEQVRLAKLASDTTGQLTRLQQAAKSRGVSEADSFGILGLRPYELQNLGFQINDFFTQIASGTSATQAFAQQIGQVLQINRVGAALVAALPAVVAIGGAFVVAASAVSRYVDQLSLLRAASSQQSFGGGFDPKTVLEVARSAERLGVAFSEARETALALSRLPLNLEQYRQAVEIVTQLSVAGRDAKAEIDRLRDALNGGVEGILKYDQEFGRLTTAQREFIASAQTQEQRIQAISTFLDVYTGAAQRARSEATTPLGDALRALRQAWNDFLDSLASSAAINAVTTAINFLAGSVRNLASSMRDVRSAVPAMMSALGNLPGGALLGFAGRALGSAPVQSILRTGGGSTATPGTPAATGQTPEEIALEREWAGRFEVARALNAQAEAQRRLAAESRTRIDQLEREDRLNQLIEKGTDRNATAAQRRASIEAAGQRARAQFLRENANADDAALARAEALGRAQQQRKVDEAAERAGERAAKAGVAAQRRELEGIEQDLQRLTQTRDDLFRTIQEDVQTGAIDSVQAFERMRAAAARLAPEFAKVAAEARQFAAANQNNPDVLRRARADALVTRAGRLEAGGGQTQPIQQNLSRQRQELTQAVQERTNLITSINALEQQGAITTFDAQQRIREAYALTNDSIQGQIAELEKLTAAMVEAGQISSVVAANIRSQIELARAQLVFVDPQIARIRQTIEQTGSQQAISALTEIANLVGEIALGYKSWGEAAQAAGRIILRTFANILQAIAETILKQQILNAIQAVGKVLGFGSPAAAPAAAVRVRRLGGIVGTRNNAGLRRVDPAWFAGARHYNNGGLPGLRPGEEAAILHDGEEVLTKNDPRNIRNMRGGGGETVSTGTPIRQVLVLDPSEIAGALAGAQGESVVVTHLRRNAATIREILGG